MCGGRRGGLLVIQNSGNCAKGCLDCICLCVIWWNLILYIDNTARSTELALKLARCTHYMVDTSEWRNEKGKVHCSALQIISSRAGWRVNVSNNDD